MLRYGSTGDEVKKLQTALGINADGIYGNQTKSAVTAYQQKNGLTVDGIAGTQTLGKLYTVAAAQPPVRAASTLPTTPATQSATVVKPVTPIAPNYQKQAETAVNPTYLADADAIRRKYQALIVANQANLGTIDSSYDKQIDRTRDSYGDIKDMVNNETLNRGMGRSSYVVDKLTDVGKDEAQAVGDIESERSAQVNSINNIINSYNQQMQESLARLDTQKASQIAAKVEELQAAQLKTQIETINQYYNDYQAKIDEIVASPDTSDDALIPYLKAARQKKLQEMEQAKQEASQKAYDNAYKLWQAGATLSPEQYKLLGIPANSISNNTQKTEYSTSKPYYKPASGNTGGSSGLTLNW